MATDLTDRAGLAKDAYVYGYPLVFNTDQVRRYVKEGVGANPAAAFNTFSHARHLAGPADTFVTINNDTLYSMAQLDLSVGPLVLDVPATGERYYVLQFVDAWTNNIAYVGTRATGNEAGRFVIVPPGWSGDLPADAVVVQASTRIVSIVGRIACAGPDDVGAANSVQDQFLLRPLDPAAIPVGLPDKATSGVDSSDFFEDLRRLSQDLPPSSADVEHAPRFDPLGIGVTEPFQGLDGELATDLRSGYLAGQEVVEYASHHGSSPVDNGWTVGLHMFDYNVSALGLGTIDAPEWKIAEPAERFLDRAVAARLGLWGNHAYEAVYAQAFTDVDGDPLRGASTYRVLFDTEPPVGAFWSITLYDVPQYFLVDNPIDRYSIGDRTPGTRRADDGTLTVTISHAEPTDPAARANWLPAPDAAFRLVLRLYIPGPTILAGTYDFPPIIKA
ncbi:DUF1254 domain-containing protein [Oerskovia sp. NPDC056781]|uniref:DUF1254 domain-containing protein n=1 Tax=Oerskovia sp. NPDC056781 TaxID=3345942 RepID=UPI003671C751